MTTGAERHERMLAFKGEVAFLTATKTGVYYTVSSTKRDPVSVKRCANHSTTICLTCHAWEGTNDRGERNEIGCVHTNLVEYAIAHGLVTDAREPIPDPDDTSEVPE